MGGGAGAAASDGDNGCESEARARRQRPLRGSHVHGAARSTAGGESTKALLFLNACDKHVSRWAGGGAVYANAAWMNMFSGPLFARRRLLLDAAARARPTFTRESYEAAATRATSLATYFGARVTRPHALAASPPGNASRNALELKPTARTPTNHARKTPDGMGSTASTDMPAARL